MINLPELYKEWKDKYGTKIVSATKKSGKKKRSK
jgi:hypothetical protein